MARLMSQESDSSEESNQLTSKKETSLLSERAELYVLDAVNHDQEKHKDVYKN